MSVRSFILVAMSFFGMDLALGKELGKASFHAEGEGLALDIDGAGAKVMGDVKKGDGGLVSGKFSIKLADLKTGIGLRDEHMCKALECEKFPLAHFSLEPFSLKDGPVKGELELRGVKKKVSGWHARVSGNLVKVSGKLKLKDFGIEPPGYQGAKVSNEIDIEVEVSI